MNDFGAARPLPLAGVDAKTQPQSLQYSCVPRRGAPQTAQVCGTDGISAAGSGSAGASGPGGAATDAAAGGALLLSGGGSGGAAGVVALSRANMACKLGGEEGFESDAMTAYYLCKRLPQ
jgi:hypothetical protein